jgi:outer membrane protein assembly factor BamB
MRFMLRVVTAAVAFGFPLAFASGCAPGGLNGTPITPAASMPLSSQWRSAKSPDWRTAGKTAQWPQFGYAAGHTGFNPLEDTITTQNVSDLQVAWNDSSIVQPGGIVVNKNVIYVDDMGQSNAGLYALDATTGAQKWYANVNLNGGWGSFTHAVAAVAGNVVVTPCSNGSSSKFLTGLCGVNAKSGKSLWSTYCTEYQGNPCGGIVDGGTSPTLYANLIYFQSVQGVNEQPDTQALNPKTGAIVWDVPGVYHCPDAGDTSDDPLPAANGEVFAVLGCQGAQGATEICAFSASSGSTTWCDNSPTAYIQGLIAGNGRLYVVEPGPGSSNSVVVALNATSGAQEWSANLPLENGSAMATANGSLFIDDVRAGLYALSAKTGRPLWSYTANGNAFGGGVLSVANGIVYTDGGGGNNGNYAIDAFNAKNGNLIWQSTSAGNGGAPATPVILDGTVYAGCYTVCAFALPPSDNKREP